MTPSPRVGLILALAAFRVVRLVSYDTFPLAVQVRGWVTGEMRGPAGNVIYCRLAARRAQNAAARALCVAIIASVRGSSSHANVPALRATSRRIWS